VEERAAGSGELRRSVTFPVSCLTRDRVPRVLVSPDARALLVVSGLAQETLAPPRIVVFP